MTAPAFSPAPENESLGDEHMRRVHGDGSECPDGCDMAVLPEQDRRCPDCQNWLDRYGRCLQCTEPAGEL